MNNQSSNISASQNTIENPPISGDDLSQVFSGFRHINSQHLKMDMASTHMLLRLALSGELVMAEAETSDSAECLAYLRKAGLISGSEANGISTLTLTVSGRKLAAEVADLFATAACAVQ